MIDKIHDQNLQDWFSKIEDGAYQCIDLAKILNIRVPSELATGYAATSLNDIEKRYWEDVARFMVFCESQPDFFDDESPI